MLLERDAETAAITELLQAAAAGSGGILMFRGGAGAGKTALLRAARQEAARRGMLVLSARGADFEQDFPFGTARQLFATVVADTRSRDRLFDGPAALCRSLFPVGDDPTAPTDDTSAAMVEGLAWLVARIAAGYPPGVLLAVDDLQVCDRASLRALARLTLTLEDTGVAVLLAHRVRSAGTNADLISWLAADPRATVLEPQPLSADAVGRLVAARLGAPATEVALACRDVTGGNPFLIGELLAALRADDAPASNGTTVRRVLQMVPDAVLRSVTARLRKLGDEAGRLAQAVVVLGPGAELADAAALAGVSPGAAVHEVARLVEEGLFSGGDALAFCHPLVSSAVDRDMSELERSQLHGRAATVLLARGGDDERIAAHLLASSPVGDPDAAAILRRAAAAKMKRGGPDGAVPLLRRALAELPSPDERGPVVLELARAEAAAGDPAAHERLETALMLVTDPRERIHAMRDLTRLQFMNEHHAEAARMARQALRLVGEDDPLARDLLAEYVATGGFGSGTLDPDIRVETEELATRMAQQYFEHDLPDSPALFVQVASMLAGSRGRRSDVRELIKAALRHGHFDDIPPFGLAPIWATLALTSADCLDLAGLIADRAYRVAEASGSIHKLGTAAFSVAIVSLESGALDRAEPECTRAVELTQSGVPATLPWSAGILATARRLRGDLVGARRAIHIGERTDPSGYTYGIVVYHRALLALAEGDARSALADALEARSRLTDFRIQDYSLLAWRVPAASAAHRLGRLDEARQYAEEELALARRAVAAKPIGVALMCCAGVEPDPRRQIELLEEAHSVLAQSRDRLARTRAASCLGAALRRTGSPGSARQHLLDAFDLATECGAQPLMERLRGELRALGIRAPHSPRQPGGLSPSEMRTAELAVAGHSNRAIAERLHLSTSTVEFHLTRAYRKLGIRSRSELAGVLDPVGDGAD